MQNDLIFLPTDPNTPGAIIMRSANLPAGLLATCLSGILALTGATQLLASDWPHWRGPSYNGSTDETGLPEKWSQTENVAWVVDLPGSSAATPIILGDNVFISATDSSSDQLVAMCLDRRSGKTLWRHNVATGLRRDSRSNFAAPSPVTDGERVVFFYGSGQLASFNLDGKLQWQRNIQEDFGEFAFLWTFSSSPLLHDGTLYLQVLQRDVAVDGRGFSDRVNESYLLAMSPETGETLWRHVRPSKAVAESREAFSSPIPIVHEGRRQILIAGGDDLSGHDPQTGRELWRWETYNEGRIPHWRLVPSPVYGAGVALVCAPKGDPIYAVPAGESGIIPDNRLAWISDAQQTPLSADVPTPAFYDGDFFVLADKRNTVFRVDPSSGDIKWSSKAPGREKYEASPLVADGKIYIVNFLGEVTVMSTEDGSIIHEVTMDEPSDEDPVRASIAAANGQLFIRTSAKLFCIGK